MSNQPSEQAAAETKPEKKPTAEPTGEKPAKKKEPKPRAPKEGGKEAKGKPDAAPAAASAAPGAPTSPSAAGAPSAPAVTGGVDLLKPTKDKGRRPGCAPAIGKQLREHRKNIAKKLDKEGTVPLKRAVALLKEVSNSRKNLKKKEGKQRKGFDETVEVHMHLGVDTTQSDQMVRGSVPLPHGVGKSVRVIIFCQGENVGKAKEAGAEEAGSDELIKRIQGGWLDFDVALATQDMMAQVSRLGKVLGPRGLMPTPKAGTVVTTGSDVGAAVREFKAGKVEYRADKSGNVHAGVGKLSFDDDKLIANITAFVEQVRAAKPSGVKGNYIRSITLSSTQSPGIAVSM